MIIAHFDNLEVETVRCYGVWRYDWGQQLKVTGLESLGLPNHTEVHFEIDGEDGQAITRIATVTNGVLICDVPFKCMQFAKRIKAYIYVLNDGADGGRTIRQVEFTPRDRAKADDDVTPDEERTVDAILRELNAATKQAQIDVAGAAASAKKALRSEQAAAASERNAETSEAAAAEAQAVATREAAAAQADRQAVTEMYNNLTIIIDGGDAVNIDTHIIDGGTATSAEGRL